MFYELTDAGLELLQKTGLAARVDEKWNAVNGIMTNQSRTSANALAHILDELERRP